MFIVQLLPGFSLPRLVCREGVQAPACSSGRLWCLLLSSEQPYSFLHPVFYLPPTSSLEEGKPLNPVWLSKSFFSPLCCEEWKKEKGKQSISTAKWPMFGQLGLRTWGSFLVGVLWNRKVVSVFGKHCFVLSFNANNNPCSKRLYQARR